MNTGRMFRRVWLFSAAFVGLLFMTTAASAQVSLKLPGVPATADLTGFTGAGFAPTPAAGQLDSDTWSVRGLSDGDVLFGGTGTTGDFARGTSVGGVSTGGIYGFDIGDGVIALGYQSNDFDFTPGEIVIAVQNNTGEIITELEVSYLVWEFNDGDYSSSFGLSWSSDDNNYTGAGRVHTTREKASNTPTWRSTPYSTTLTGLDIGDGVIAFLRFRGDDHSVNTNGGGMTGGGGGDVTPMGDIPPPPTRDEVAVNSITVTVTGTVKLGASCTTDAECDDTNVCNGVELCVSGVCEAGMQARPGTPCGDTTTDTTCNGADTCNNKGECIANIAPEGTACGDATETECDLADTCDGLGECQANLVAFGEACGDQTSTDCDLVDFCDGGGTCDDNIPEAGTSCSDGFSCNGEETCDGTGQCLAGEPPAGETCDGLACASDADCPMGAWCDTNAGLCSTANRIPTAVIDGPTEAMSGATIALFGQNSSDPDGDPLTYRWAQTDGPPATISNPTADTTNIIMPDVAVDALIVVTLTVNDGSDDSLPATHQITVLGNGGTADAGGDVGSDVGADTSMPTDTSMGSDTTSGADSASDPVTDTGGGAEADTGGSTPDAGTESDAAPSDAGNLAGGTNDKGSDCACAIRSRDRDAMPYGPVGLVLLGLVVMWRRRR